MKSWLAKTECLQCHCQQIIFLLGFDGPILLKLLFLSSHFLVRGRDYSRSYGWPVKRNERLLPFSWPRPATVLLYSSPHSRECRIVSRVFHDNLIVVARGKPGNGSGWCCVCAASNVTEQILITRLILLCWNLSTTVKGMAHDTG